MKRFLLICAVVVLVMGVSTVFAEQPDKEKLMLRAQALHEKILRLRTEIAVSVEEHNKAVNEFKAIIQILEAMEKETDA